MAGPKDGGFGLIKVKSIVIFVLKGVSRSKSSGFTGVCQSYQASGMLIPFSGLNLVSFWYDLVPRNSGK